MRTSNLTQENIDKLATVFPQVVTEVEEELSCGGGALHRAIDFDMLRSLLGDVAEGARERYRFTWPGKSRAQAEAHEGTDKTMRPCREKSEKWDTTENLYIEGDNLDALKLLRETYAGKVRLCYIDPPYNTGHEFLYEDDFSVDQESFADESGEYDEDGRRLVSNPASSGRFHSRWCSNIYARLILARDLLSADGAIFISIDDNESYNLRKICNEVFGESCFVGDVAWQKTYSPRNDAQGLPAEIEHLLVYSRQPGWRPKRLERTQEMDDRYSAPDGDPRPWKAGDASAPGASTHKGMVYAIQHPMTGELLYPPSGRCRPLGAEQMYAIMSEWAEYEFRDIQDWEKRAEICGCSSDEMHDGVRAIMLKEASEETFRMTRKRYEAGSWPRLCFTNKGVGGMIFKRYLDEVEGKLPTNFWPYAEVGHTDEAKKELKKLFDGNAPFDTPKPVRLMKRILDIASDKDSLVLDFYSGSASMADAVMQKNAEDGGSRKFILVQIDEPVSGQFSTLCEVGEERIRRAGKRVDEEFAAKNSQQSLFGDGMAAPDTGFRVLHIDSSNFRDTGAAPDATSQNSLIDLIDNVKEGRTAEDLLFQVLPNFRIPYSARMRELDLEGRKVFDVNDGQLLACFDADISNSVVEAMARRKPSYAVVRDLSFRDSSAAANFDELFKTFSPDTVRRVI